MRFNQLLEASYSFSRQEMEQMIRQIALKYEIDPDVAIKLWRAEGAMHHQSRVKTGNAQKHNGREDSWGPFQLYLGGGMGNDYAKFKYGADTPETRQKVRDEISIDDIKDQIDFAMKSAASKQSWKPWMGAKAAGIGKTQGFGFKVDPTTADRLLTTTPDTSPRPRARPDQSAAPDTSPRPQARPRDNIVLRKGSRGDEVRDLQQAIGMSTDQQDGIFGPQTQKALADFQKRAGLTVDGVAGQETFDYIANNDWRTQVDKDAIDRAVKQALGIGGGGSTGVAQ